jgi:hypothetical protein
MNSSGIIHITVNGHGRIRTWDTPATALSGKEPDEVVVQLSLTAPQMRVILRAEQLAREKQRTHG